MNKTIEKSIDLVGAHFQSVGGPIAVLQNIESIRADLKRLTEENEELQKKAGYYLKDIELKHARIKDLEDKQNNLVTALEPFAAANKLAMASGETILADIRGNILVTVGALENAETALASLNSEVNL